MVARLIYGLLLGLVALIHIMFAGSLAGKQCPDCLARTEFRAKVCQKCGYRWSGSEGEGNWG